MIERTLRELNPVRDASATYEPDRAAADLERILGQSRRPARVHRAPARHRHGRRLAVIAIAGCIAVALALGLPFLPWRTAPTALAATPPLLAGELAPGTSGATVSRDLDDLAERASGSAGASDPGRPGASYSAWDLSTRIHGAEPVRSAVVPLEVTVAQRPDGTLHRSAVVGAPVAGDTKAADVPAAGTVAFTGASARLFTKPLSADPTRLRAQLEVAHPIDDLGSAELFVALTDLAKEQTPPPGVRAAALRVVAAAPDVRALGSLADRAGRRGLAFAVDSDMSGLPTRYVVIFDPATGRLLASEQVLTTRAGRLEVKVPAVTSYALFR